MQIIRNTGRSYVRVGVFFFLFFLISTTNNRMEGGCKTCETPRHSIYFPLEINNPRGMNARADSICRKSFARPSIGRIFLRFRYAADKWIDHFLGEEGRDGRPRLTRTNDGKLNDANNHYNTRPVSTPMNASFPRTPRAMIIAEVCTKNRIDESLPSTTIIRLP